MLALSLVHHRSTYQLRLAAFLEQIRLILFMAFGDIKHIFAADVPVQSEDQEDKWQLLVVFGWKLVENHKDGVLRESPSLTTRHIRFCEEPYW